MAQQLSFLVDEDERDIYIAELETQIAELEAEVEAQDWQLKCLIETLAEVGISVFDCL